jgi:predicted nucleotidyltransferase component of viral defense system
VEVNINEKESLFPLVPISISVPVSSGAPRELQVVSYDLDEMLGTKLRALLQREHGRDLFDLWSAWRTSETPNSGVMVDPRRVGAAFRFYMAQEPRSFSSVEVRNELDRRMASKKFLADMNGYLPVGRRYDPKHACEEFCAIFLPHLDG